jgi:hypothetical protein
VVADRHRCTPGQDGLPRRLHRRFLPDPARLCTLYTAALRRLFTHAIQETRN